MKITSESILSFGRYDKEGLGAIRTSLFLKRAGVDSRPKTFSHRSKTSVELKVRPKSEAKVTICKLDPQPQNSEEPKAGETTQEKSGETTEVEVKTSENTDKTAQPETNKDNREPDKGEEVKVNVSRKKKVQPKLDNIIDCLHYRVSCVLIVLYPVQELIPNLKCFKCQQKIFKGGLTQTL